MKGKGQRASQYTIKCAGLYTWDRGSIPAKVGFWVGIRMFSYVPTPTKPTNAISKTQLLGPKRGGSCQNTRM